MLMIDLPRDVEDQLREDVNFDTYARRVLAVQLYRDHRITHVQLQKILGVSRFEVDAIIKEQGGFDEISAEELAEQVENAHRASIGGKS